jgi:hypothetical protein
MFIGGHPSQQDIRSLLIAERGIALSKKGVKLLLGRVKFLDIPYSCGVLLKVYLYLPHPRSGFLVKRPY